MAWQDTLTIAIRFLINDFETPYTYSDEKIQQMSTIAAIYASADFPFSNDYTISVEESSITPDPVTSNDDVFIALVTLKAACLFNLNQYQGATVKGIKVRSGEESFDTTSGFRGYSDILKNGPCASYEKLLKDLRGGTASGSGTHLGRAVASCATNPNSYNGVFIDFYNRIGYIGRPNYRT